MNPIVLDARLLHYNRTGIGRYLRHLYQAIAALPDPLIQYLVVAYHRKDQERALASALPRAATLVTPAHHPLERWTLAAELLRLRPALLHAPDHVCPQPLGWRTVLTIHDLAFWRMPETHSPASRAYYAGVQRSVAQATHVICVSDATRRDVLALCGPQVEPKLRVVHEAPDPTYSISSSPANAARPAPNPKSKIQNPKSKIPFFLFAGTIEPRKNVARIIAALAAFPQTPEPRPRLLIAGGDGTGAAEVRALPARLGIAQDVEFLGWTPPDQLAALYRDALAVVYPSLMEGFGLPILEAMTAGTPVITSNRSSMPEVAGDAALLVDPEDEAALSQAMQRVASDPALREQLRQAGLRRAAQFTWERAARQTLEVFREALAA